MYMFHISICAPSVSMSRLVNTNNKKRLRFALDVKSQTGSELADMERDFLALDRDVRYNWTSQWVRRCQYSTPTHFKRKQIILIEKIYRWFVIYVVVLLSVIDQIVAFLLLSTLTGSLLLTATNCWKKHSVNNFYLVLNVWTRFTSVNFKILSNLLLNGIMVGRWVKLRQLYPFVHRRLSCPISRSINIAKYREDCHTLQLNSYAETVFDWSRLTCLFGFCLAKLCD